MEKALSDSDITGLPVTLANFNDGIMETAHKQNKKNSLLFSGGRNGPISKQQYQEQVIQQQFAMKCRETTPQKSPSTKVERKRQAQEQGKYGTKKMVITSFFLVQKVRH